MLRNALIIRTRLGRQMHPLASAQRTDHFRQQGQPAASEVVGPQNRPIARHPVRHPPTVRNQPKIWLNSFLQFFTATLTNRRWWTYGGTATETGWWPRPGTTCWSCSTCETCRRRCRRSGGTRRRPAPSLGTPSTRDSFAAEAPMAHSSSGMLGKLISLIMKGWLKTKEGSFFNQFALCGRVSVHTFATRWRFRKWNFKNLIKFFRALFK